MNWKSSPVSLWKRVMNRDAAFWKFLAGFLPHLRNSDNSDKTQHISPRKERDTRGKEENTEEGERKERNERRRNSSMYGLAGTARLWQFIHKSYCDTYCIRKCNNLYNNLKQTAIWKEMQLTCLMVIHFIISSSHNAFSTSLYSFVVCYFGFMLPRLRNAWSQYVRRVYVS